MNAQNPFAPPKAAVADMMMEGDGFQPVRLWPPKGRIGRLRFLAYSMAAYLVMVVAAFVLGFIFGAAGLRGEIAGLLVLIPYMVAIVLLIILRTHDMNMNGWMSLLAFVPIVNLYWIFKGGSPGANRYGAPPPPNTLGVKILGLAIPVIAAIGIVAAIALPAYQGYAKRAAVEAR